MVFHTSASVDVTVVVSCMDLSSFPFMLIGPALCLTTIEGY